MGNVAPVTFGTDLEVVVMDVDMRPLSAIDLIEGTKEKPFTTKHGYIQHDNLLAELNTLPVSRQDDWVESILSVMGDLKLYLETHWGKKKYPYINFSCLPIIKFPSKVFEDPRAMTLGCVVDYDSWTEQIGEAPDALAMEQNRTCGGHLHMRFNEKKYSVPELFAIGRTCDLLIGLRGLYTWERKTIRRKFYGQAGRVRLNPDLHHLEYRTPTNEWARDPSWMKLIFKWMMEVVNRPFLADELIKDDKELIEDIKEIINSQKKGLAGHMLNFLEIKVR